jgi:hydroxymethylpyrimidine/phosphomethylpyrimidine kinase
MGGRRARTMSICVGPSDADAQSSRSAVGRSGVGGRVGRPRTGGRRLLSWPAVSRSPSVPRVLSIAGSDSGGGAGIQADLKAFAACGVHGMTAITAITAQNTVAVTAVHPIPGEIIVAQVQAVAEDIGVDAVKIGMLGDEATIRAVADALDLLPEGTPVVIDPVMVAESGAELLAATARRALVQVLLPRATAVTPNVPEARALAAVAGAKADEDDEPAALAKAIRALGPDVVVVTGGHREQAIDTFFDGERLVELPGPRYGDGGAHGSGCTHSSVLAARLAWGDDPLSAAREAKRLAARAVARGLAIGAGAGPVNVLGVGVENEHDRRQTRFENSAF